MARSADPQIITIQEYKTLETDLLSGEQATYLRDRFRNYLKVERAWSGNAWLLTASHHVGTIVLDDLHIVIQPKVRVENLFYMLTYAYELPEFRQEETFLDVGEDIFEFIVTIFVQRVQQLIRQGLYRNYVVQEEQQAYLRGRLLMAEHLRQNVVYSGRFYQRTHEYTADLPENQILKYTLWLVAQLGYQDQSLSRQLRHTCTAFAEVTHTIVQAAECRRIQFNRFNQRYRTPINLASLLLRHLSLEGGRGHQRFGTYLFNMNEVFEKFVGRYLQECFRTDDTIEVVLQDHIWLDAERQEKGIPDIVVRHNGQTTCVADTKYKPFYGVPDPGDRNQMWVYSQRMKVREAVLIYPGEHLVPYHTTFEGIPLRATALPLIGTLEAFRTKCRHFAEQFA